MKKKIYLTIFLILFLTSCTNSISNFDECVNAGNPVMESFPRQCQANEKIFVEDISYLTDGVLLTQHNETGEIACYGCSSIKAKVPMCKDPISEMKPIEETYELHCNEDFEIVRR